MEFFDSVFTDGLMTVGDFFLCLGIAIIGGLIFSMMTYYKSTSSKSFYVTTSLIPACVAIVIMLVNGNIGAGVAVAGAFSLVRFRSAQGTAKEICIIFIAMAAGLAYGMGYLAYGSIFLIFAGAILMALSVLKIWEPKANNVNKILKITIPESLDYNSVFDDILSKYTKDNTLVKVKSINMGSMFSLTYYITLKDIKQEKEFIDELRCRNGNLEISVLRQDFNSEL